MTPTLDACLRLIVIGYLPGAVLFRLPILNRRQRAGLALEERTFWAILISLSLSLLTGLALASVGQYSLTRLLTANLVVLGALALAVRGRLMYRGTASLPTLRVLVPLCLVALGLWQYFPPSEYIIGGKDPGTYMNEGIQIAQRGTILVEDPVVRSVPPDERRLFFPSHHRPTYYGIRFMGFFIIDPERGTVLGQFPHLYPMSIAIGYGIDGLTGARRTVGVWAIVGLLSVYFAGARLIGWVPAAAGTVLLSLNVVQVWFARYPNAEVVMQALLFAALLAAARSLVDGDPFFAPVMSCLMVTLLFLRYDAVLGLAGLGLTFVLGVVVRRRLPPLSMAILGAGLVVWWVYLTDMMAPYADYPLKFIRNLGPMWLLPLLAGACLLAGLLVISRSRQTALRIVDLLPRILGWGVAGLAIYAYFLRQAGRGLAIHDATAIHAFSWYVTRPGLALAVIGCVLLIRRSFWRDPALLMTGAIYSVFFLYKLRIVPEHFWAARRFLPVILPCALLWVAYAALRAFDSGPFGVRGDDGWRPAERRWPRMGAISFVLGSTLLLWMGWRFVDASNAIRHHVEYAGLIPRVEQLATRFGPNDLIIVESRNSSDMHVLALPLAYIYTKNVLVLNSPRPIKPLFRRFLDQAETRYDDVYFLGGGGTDLLSRSIAVTALASDRFQVPEYESPRNAYPTHVRMKEFDFGIYRFVRSGPAAPWFSLDVGTLDDLNVVRFHAKERMGDTSFRWTRDVSYISIINLRPDARQLTLWLNDGHRPPHVAPAHMSVSLDDRLLGRTDVGNGFRPYTFGIPADLARSASERDEPARLRLETNPWNPKAALGTFDDRWLGVMVDRAEAR